MIQYELPSINSNYEPVFTKTRPSILIVDNFYKNPDKIRAHALQQPYRENLKFYKGFRSHDTLLLPFVKEEFERLLGVQITDWLNQSANGIFQKTLKTDPLVFHADGQDFAGAVYLTPNLPTSMGTSMWKHKATGCRRPAGHPLEPNSSTGIDIFTKESLVTQSYWELVDKVGAVYNRLVLWDAKLIHSASEYSTDTERLVQLFFFNIKSSVNGGLQ